MEYISVFSLKMSSGVRTIVKDVLVITYLGTEGLEYVSVFNLKMPSGMHVIVKDVLVVTYLLSQLFFMLCLLLFLVCLN